YFIFKPTAATTLYTLSLHDALPISRDGGIRRPARQGLLAGGARQDRARPRARSPAAQPGAGRADQRAGCHRGARPAPPARIAARDRKSTRLNSSHVSISYAVFCLKK